MAPSSLVIASSHLLRRGDRLKKCLGAEPWDLIVLDEAHHARRRSAGAAKEGGPNALLRLMQGLKDRTKGLVLLTATPMQVDPIEVWDLLSRWLAAGVVRQGVSDRSLKTWYSRTPHPRRSNAWRPCFRPQNARLVRSGD